MVIKKSMQNILLILLITFCNINIEGRNKKIRTRDNKIRTKNKVRTKGRRLQSNVRRTLDIVKDREIQERATIAVQEIATEEKNRPQEKKESDLDKILNIISEWSPEKGWLYQINEDITEEYDMDLMAEYLTTLSIIILKYKSLGESSIINFSQEITYDKNEMEDRISKYIQSIENKKKVKDELVAQLKDEYSNILKKITFSIYNGDYFNTSFKKICDKYNVPESDQLELIKIMGGLALKANSESLEFSNTPLESIMIICMNIPEETLKNNKVSNEAKEYINMFKRFYFLSLYLKGYRNIDFNFFENKKMSKKKIIAYTAGAIALTVIIVALTDYIGDKYNLKNSKGKGLAGRILGSTTRGAEKVMNPIKKGLYYSKDKVKDAINYSKDKTKSAWDSFKGLFNRKERAWKENFKRGDSDYDESYEPHNYQAKEAKEAEEANRLQEAERDAAETRKIRRLSYEGASDPTYLYQDDQEEAINSHKEFESNRARVRNQNPNWDSLWDGAKL